MKRFRSTALLAAIAALVLMTSAAGVRSATFNSGSTGADGAFAPTTSQAVQLPDSGVFNYTTVNIPAGVTITFLKNAKNTPVTILASGDVTIAGKIDVSGAKGTDAPTTFPGSLTRVPGGAGGPGGFDGGQGGGFNDPYLIATAGDGPGGGPASPNYNGAGGSYGSVGGTSADGFHGVTYGSPTLLPLLGGSGGGGGHAMSTIPSGGGGGGGGAIVIASNGTLSLNSGSILCNGGAGGAGGPGWDISGGGSGGGIRLVATTLSGTATLSVQGGTWGSGGNGGYGAGGYGYVRLEAFTFSNFVATGIAPANAFSTALPSSVTLPTPPQLQIVSVGGVNSPAAPAGSHAGTPDITLPAGQANPVSVSLQGQNIPLGTVASVIVTPQVGAEVTVPSTALAGTVANSTATANVTLPTGTTVLTATASFPAPAGAMSLGVPIFINGQQVDRIEVKAAAGKSSTTYLSRSGKPITIK